MRNVTAAIRKTNTQRSRHRRIELDSRRGRALLDRIESRLLAELRPIRARCRTAAQLRRLDDRLLDRLIEEYEREGLLSPNPTSGQRTSKGRV